LVDFAANIVCRMRNTLRFGTARVDWKGSSPILIVYQV